MIVLSDEDIKQYCTKCELIENYEDKNIQPASYDLRVGEEYLIASEGEIKFLKERGDKLIIPPSEMCFILTEETINLPNDICAIIFPRNEYVKRGLLMYPQPSIDPGYNGKLYVLLHNLTDTSVELRRSEALATIAFLKLANPSKGYSGKYQKAKSLKDFHIKTFQSGLKEIRSGTENLGKEFKEFKESYFTKYMTNILTLVTVILMILTIMFTIVFMVKVFGKGGG